MSTNKMWPAILSLFALALCPLVATAAGGGSGYAGYFLTSVDRGQPAAPISASVALDIASFRVNSVDKQYKLVPFVLENQTNKPIVLSAERDSVAVITAAGASIVASLQMARLNRALWDSWDSSAQARIEYPQSVAPQGSRAIYVFVRQSELTDVPAGIDFTIASLGLTLKLRHPPAMAY